MALVERSEGRAVIPGVRQVTWAGGEMCEFAGVMISAETCLGNQVDYDFIMGVSGAAFRLTVYEDPWEPGSYSITMVSVDTMAPVRRAFAAVGRRYELYDVGDRADDTAAILASIDAGVPVPAFGVVGPSDCCLVTGYDQGGEVLLGWSTFQDIPDDHPFAPDATGYFRRPDWHVHTRGYILLDAQAPLEPAADSSLEALRWAVELGRQPEVKGRHTGPEAYDWWAAQLLSDGDFADPAGLGGPYLGHLCNLMMIDDRRSAAPFLLRVSEDQPAMAWHLASAASEYEQTCALREKMRELVPEDFSESAMQRLADRTVREELAACLMGMCDHDAMAVARIEEALASRV